jgi:hypothetical protein
MTGTYDIQFVAAVDACDGGARLRFRNGAAALVPATHPDHDLFLLLVDHSLRLGCPVGFVLDPAGSVLDLNSTYQSAVQCVRDDPEDANRLEVWLWAFSPVCHLTRDHPEFARILATLKDAAASGSLVWFANCSRLIEGETLTWHKLLDVRPVAAPVSGQPTEPGGAVRDANGVPEQSRAPAEPRAASMD